MRLWKENLSIYYSHHLFFLKKHFKSLVCLFVLPKKEKRNEKKGANERPKKLKKEQNEAKFEAK